MLKKGQLSIFLVNLAYLLFFLIYYISKKNYEFLVYIGVVTFFLILIIATNKRVKYPNYILWGLTAWGFLHMSGGSLYLNGTRLYDIILIPLSSSLPILRYDQLLHIFGFGVCTLIMYHLIRPLLKPNLKRWAALSIVIVMAGFGVGALNEVIEFMATLVAAKHGVGGYVNTSLDLVANLIGAIIAIVIIRIKEK